MTWLAKIVAIVLVALLLPSCSGPTDSQVEADARAIIRLHLGNAVDVLWIDYSSVDGGSVSMEWNVGLVLIGKSNQRVSAGAFQGLVVSDGAVVSAGAMLPRTQLHLFYMYREDLKAWELDAFSVTLPNQATRGPVWEWSAGPVGVLGAH